MPHEAALIAILAIEGPTARANVALRLWPEARSRSQASNNMRKLLQRLHEKLREEFPLPLFSEDQHIALTQGVHVDLLALPQAPVAAQLAAGELLGGMDYGRNDMLAAWVAEQRERVREERAQRLAREAEELVARHALADAIGLAEAIVAIAPLGEHHWRRLVRVHYLRGDPSAALHCADRCDAVLLERTGDPAGPEMQALREQVRLSGQPAPAAARALPLFLRRPPRLVGRDDERAAIAAAWALGQAVLLVGEAGIGKSRLLQDCGARAGASLLAAAQPGDADVPYAVLSRLMQALQRAYPAAVGSDDARLLDTLLHAAGASGVVPEGIVRHAAERALCAAQRAGLRALLVDDLQLVDRASFDTLRWLGACPSLAGLRRVYATRPLDQPSNVQPALAGWLEGSHHPRVLALGPLSRSGVEALLRSLELALAPGSAERAFRRAGGHPLFTLETLRESFRPGAAWQVVEERGLGGEVGTLLMRRLRALPEPALRLLRVAAVAGPDLDADRAARLLRTDRLDLADPWSQLQDAGVLEGARFAHDLMREAAESLVPQAVAASLHAELAALLAQDPAVPAARVAEHWHAAQRWAPAAQAWRAAAAVARHAGRFAEQRELLERAALCARRAGDVAGEFDAAADQLEGLLFLHGGQGVLAALPALLARAANDEQRCRCGLHEAEALVDLERAAEAAAAADALVAATQAHPALLPDALALQAMAWAQCGRFDAACTAAAQAVADAAPRTDPALQLRTQRAQAYVLYAAGRIAQAVPAQRAVLRRAEALGDVAEAAAAAGSLAALLNVVGDTPAVYAHAQLARRQMREMALARQSSLAAANLVALGQAAAAIGRMEEALEVLHEAVAMVGDSPLIAARAKPRLWLANTLLLLGAADAAAAVLDELPPAMSPGMQMQAWRLQARLTAMRGGDTAPPLQQLARLFAEHPDLPYVQSAYPEASVLGEARPMVVLLRGLRARPGSAAMPGAMRTVQVCELHRLNELDDAVTEGLCLAEDLLPALPAGLSVRSYVPEAYEVLARAYERAGRTADARRCRHEGARWIHAAALPHVPAQHRTSFLQANPVNRRLLAAS